MKTNPMCIVCGVVLDSENWYTSSSKNRQYICNGCQKKRAKLQYKANPEKVIAASNRWKKANPEKVRASLTKACRKQGVLPFDENKECTMYLGVHIAERVLSKVFKDVKRMPMGNPGYDIICNHKKKIDIKSACLVKDGKWRFNIKRNTTADYFLCLAFDNREDLNPLHAWLIPGSEVNHQSGVSISPNTISKWDAYALDISKISDCCDAMR